MARQINKALSDQASLNQTFQASVITLFPELFPGVLCASLIGRAAEKKIWQLNIVDLKQFASHTPSHHIDGTPAGGGAGMILRPDIAAAAIDATKPIGDTRPLIYLTPSGTPLTQTKIQALAKLKGVVILCGRYEGVDQRVLDSRNAEEISIGDFVLAGGEVAAMAILEAILRLLPNVIGSPNSLDEESFGENYLLEYPHYTSPAIWESRAIPDVLLSGHHQAIAQWRTQQARLRTAQRRPDLLSLDKNKKT